MHQPEPLANLSPLPLQLVAVHTATEAVTFLVTRHPDAIVEHLGTHIEVAHRLAVVTVHAERIAQQLRDQFAMHRLNVASDRPWFLVDWEDVELALADFDPATGRRTKLDGLTVGDEVLIDLSTANLPGEKRRGEVVAITGRRYMVRLHKHIGNLTGTWAPRSALKPLIKLAHSAEA